MRLFLLFGFAILLSACVAPSERSAAMDKAGPNPPSVTEFDPIYFEGETATPQERARCEAAGGDVARGGLRGWENCYLKTPDAGKICRGSEECLGQCLADGNPEIGVPTTGTCQPVTPFFGCFGVVEDGMAGPMLCVD